MRRHGQQPSSARRAGVWSTLGWLASVSIERPARRATSRSVPARIRHRVVHRRRYRPDGMGTAGGIEAVFCDCDEQGNLEFHAMPAVERSILQRILAVSIVTHSLFQRFVDEEGPQFVRVHNRGRKVACLLMGRLRALGVSNSTRILVVGQPQVPDETPENLETNRGILECAKRNNLDALNLCLVLQALPDAARRDLYFPNHRHMTPAGNALVAKEIARVLR